MDPLTVISRQELFEELMDSFVDEITGWLNRDDVRRQAQQQAAIRKSFES